MELFKIGYVIFVSRWFVRKQHLLNSGRILLLFFIMNAALLLVFLFIPDLGAVLIMGLTGLIIGIYAGISVKNILTMLVLAGTGLMTVVW